jgi:hypothetical protein
MGGRIIEVTPSQRNEYYSAIASVSIAYLSFPITTYS